MAKALERPERDQAAVAEVLRDLQALPPGHKLSPDELMSFIRRLPKMPEGWTSADYIRELRGPLPEDDPDFPPHDRR